MTTPVQYAAPAADGPLSRREEARRDALTRAQIERENAAARDERRRAEDRAWAQERRQARAGKDARRAARRAERARAWDKRLRWLQGHLVDLLFIPVVVIPGALAWSAMAAYGQSVWGPLGTILPAFSEGAMWVFDAAVVILRRRNDKLGEDKPVWHLQLGILIFAAYGAVLNFLRGMSPAMTHHGLVAAVSMAIVSVAGVTAHQLVAAGPRKSRAERELDRARRAAERRESAARKAAVRRALVDLDESGHAALVYEPGTFRLHRGAGGHRLVPEGSPLPALEPEPARPAQDECRQSGLRQASLPDARTPDIPTATRTDTGARTVSGPRTPAPSRTDATARTNLAAHSEQESRTGEGAAVAPLEDAPRASVVEMVAGQIRGAIDAGEAWSPDYPELMRLTGRRRSWCEKVVRDARNLLLTPAGDSPGSDPAPGGEARTGARPGHDRTVKADGTRTGEEDRTGAPALTAA